MPTSLKRLRPRSFARMAVAFVLLLLGISTRAAVLPQTPLGYSCAYAIGRSGNVSELAYNIASLTFGLSPTERAELVKILSAESDSSDHAINPIIQKLLLLAVQSDRGQFATEDAWSDFVITHINGQLDPQSRAALEIELGNSPSAGDQDPNTKSIVDSRYRSGEIREDYAKIKVLFPNSVLQGQKLLSIVIPAYKEQARLPGSLKKIQDFLNQYPLPIEVLVSVETSPDQTLEKAREVVEYQLWGDPRFKITDNNIHKGKGYAVKVGMQRATGKYVLFMDADLATPLPEIFKFLVRMGTHPDIDVLIGNRDNPHSDYTKNRSVLRSAMSSTFIYLTKKILAMPEISDTQCGFKMFKSGASQRIFDRVSIDGFSFDPEALLLAQRLNYKIASLDIFWTDVKGSTVNPIVETKNMLKELFRVRKTVANDLTAHPL